ncbi:MAG: helix-turn-helix transcriptional regulator [Clostridia bacterium]|nr:helix-turn-helix transcriptional regulator [Clostridia bacterium]
MYECKLAEMLVALRTARGVTQEDVAQSLSVSNKTISKWENGASMPDLPMLVELARYYGVTTDALLGLSDEKKKSTHEEICAMLDGLDRKEAVLRAFDMTRAMVPALYEKAASQYDDACDGDDVFPSEYEVGYRSCVALHELFDFTASSENVNVSVMMLRNRANFAWLDDADVRKRIVKFFRFLADEDALAVLYFIHSVTCSESFTADYIAENTGVSAERVSAILDAFCAVGECSCLTAHLIDGEVKVYECFGDGLILSVITLAFERMCGKKRYNYCYNGRCKMIGGKK